jgi:hypothetical protein
MYYIHTADKLTRTARWLEKMEGGIEVNLFLLSIIVHCRVISLTFLT